MRVNSQKVLAKVKCEESAGAGETADTTGEASVDAGEKQGTKQAAKKRARGPRKRKPAANEHDADDGEENAKRQKKAPLKQEETTPDLTTSP